MPTGFTRPVRRPIRTRTSGDEVNPFESVLYRLVSIRPVRIFFSGINDRFHAGFAVASRIKSGQRVLDVGCGLGVNCFRFAEMGCSVVGLETNPDFVRRLGKIAKKSGADISFVCARAEKMPFESDSFDRVVLSCVLHHIPKKNQKKALLEIGRVLKPSGSLLVVEPKIDSAFDKFWDNVFFKGNFYGFLEFEGKKKEIQTGSMRLIEFRKDDISGVRLKTH